jgi:DNA-binding transcriptional LysR family regulator
MYRKNRMNPKITLDQWRAFVAVVDAGGYAQAAEILHLSQSSVSYGVARIQELLGVAVFALQGRRAQLTPAGAALLPRVRQLLADAQRLEDSAKALGQGWESELVLVTDVLCPTVLVLAALKRFQPHGQGSRVQIREEVLSGADELLQSGQANLGITPRVPPECSGEALLDAEFLPVSSPGHELQRLGRPLTPQDLTHAIQVFIRDSGSGRQAEDAMSYSPQRWTVNSRETALELIRQSFGFCWAPRHWIQADLDSGLLCPLPLETPNSRRVPIYLVVPPQPGPATRVMAECIKQAAAEFASALAA